MLANRVPNRCEPKSVPGNRYGARSDASKQGAKSVPGTRCAAKGARCAAKGEFVLLPLLPNDVSGEAKGINNHRSS